MLGVRNSKSLDFWNDFLDIDRMEDTLKKTRLCLCYQINRGCLFFYWSNTNWLKSHPMLCLVTIIPYVVNHRHPNYGTIPKPIKTVMSQFDRVNDRIIQYTACSSCHKLYRPLSGISVSHRLIIASDIQLCCLLSRFRRDRQTLRRIALIPSLTALFMEIQWALEKLRSSWLFHIIQASHP